MKIIDTFTNEGKSVFVHCHAGSFIFEILNLIGIGRTGIVCVCYLLWSKHPECDSPKAAIQHFLKVRTRGPNNLQRKFIKKFFEHIQSK
jgi:protein-tyrosine phosphatase